MVPCPPHIHHFKWLIRVSCGPRPWDAIASGKQKPRKVQNLHKSPCMVYVWYIYLHFAYSFAYYCYGKCRLLIVMVNL